jgi:hypothetical protein
MLEWTPHHSSTVDFLIAEVEHVIVNGLGMYQFYTKLEMRFRETEDLVKSSVAAGIPLSHLKISGGRLNQIF